MANAESQSLSLSNSADGGRWDLSDLFSSHDDLQIETTLSDCCKRAESFSGTFRGTIHVPTGPTPEHLLEGLKELEAIKESLSRVASYSSLLYAADSLKPEYQDLEQKIEQRVTEVKNLLLFFELECMEIHNEAAARLIKDPNLKPYGHYLENLRRFHPHRLSEPEEKLVNRKDTTGSNAFGRLFSEVTSSLTFSIKREEKVEDLTLSETLALLHRSDRQLRETAWNTLLQGLSHHEQVLTFIYDTLIQDHLTMDRLRHYPNPMAERHLANEIDAGAVSKMMEVTEANYGIAQDYFRLKARLLGLPRISLFDQYAPVGAVFSRHVFSEAREVILDAFGAFSPIFRAVAEEFFAKSWIDAEIRKGKHAGAFCASPSPRLHPYILCNYTDNLRDVMILAHELGHGLHGCLSRKQCFLNYDTPLTTAESASVFGEMLVFDNLVEHQTDPRVQLALIAGKIEDAFATVFRQNVLTRFEEAAFLQRNKSRLTPGQLGSLWIEANRNYYGDSVEMNEAYRWGWSYIPHFIHSRFYCYSYVFGQLLVLSLYRMYREQGKDFVPRYIALLEAGGSESPETLLEPLGVDFHDPDFWQKGFDEIRSLVKRAEKLVESSGFVPISS
jgi:oligoendopeptidase F